MEDLLPGTRVLVMLANREDLIGWGTYLGECAVEGLEPSTVPEVLLDSGYMIYGFECYMISDSGEEPPESPESHRVDNTPDKAQIYYLEGRELLCRRGRYLWQGVSRTVCKLEVIPYMGKPCAVYRMNFNFGDKPCYALASEVGFPNYYDENGEHALP